MAANQSELEIVLSLIDNASAELKKITTDIKKDTQEVSKESEKASKSLKEGMKEAGKGLKDFRREMFIVTAGIAAITVAVKAWAENNFHARQTLDAIGVSMNRVMGAFGSIMMPVIDLAAKGLEKLAGLIEFSARGWVGLVALMQGKGLEGALKAMNEFSNSLSTTANLTEMNNQMKQMADAMSRLNLEYMTGAISAQQYYDVLSSNNVANFQNMQMHMQLTQQLTAQENLMNDQSLLNYSENVRSRMGLLKTLQDYHHTVYSSMMDFTKMFIDKFSSGMTTALTGIIMGTKKAKEAFAEFGMSLITAIVEFVIQYGIQMLIAMALSKIVLASTVAQASVIAAAWLPAAIFANMATLGAAGAAGAAGFGAGSMTMLGMAAGIKVATAAFSPSGELLETGVSGHASGGWVGLHGPELGVLGERGPEYVVPNNRLDNMGNQTTIHIEINNPTVRSDEDIDKLTEEISMRLSREAERL